MRGKIKGSNGRNKSQTVLEKAEKVSLVKALPKLAFKAPLEGETEKKRQLKKSELGCVKLALHARGSDK